MAGTSVPAGFRCGHVAIVGRPNVGKSTLLNRLVGQKLSITSRRPQTTRRRLAGVVTTAQAQVIYIDTPGIQFRHGDALQRFMRREVSSTVCSVDVLLFVMEAPSWRTSDEATFTEVAGAGAPVILAINKIDTLARRDDLLPLISQQAAGGRFTEIVPVSAKAGENVDELGRVIARSLPEAPPAFPEDQVTDCSMRFLAAELLREKLTRKLGAELPYKLAVTVDRFAESTAVTHVHATIWVESEGQKAIVIGRGGAVLKEAGRLARVDMERMLEQRVNLRTWVKVKRRWSTDPATLKQLGYSD